MLIGFCKIVMSINYPKRFILKIVMCKDYLMINIKKTK